MIIHYCDMVKKNPSKETQLRRSICDILQDTHAPMTVPQIQAVLSKKGMRPHKTSLYRNLEHMVAAGEVDRVLLDTSVMHYEMQRTHHHHIMCMNCQAIVCVGGRAMERRMAAITRDAEEWSQFLIKEHQLSLQGICDKCQK